MKVLTRERIVALPAPAHDGRVSFERALVARRTERGFASRELTRVQLAQCLWAAQGLTDLEGRRTTPSAGAAYPLEVHALVGAVEGLARAHFRYLPRRHALVEVAAGDGRAALAAAAHDQGWIAAAPLVLVLTAIPERTTFTYGERGARYVQQEAGCATQNVLLQAATLGLASAPVGAFDDPAVARLLALPLWELPLVILPIGWSARKRGV
ncbi:MAG TPA: SagB/ThcOx family dehydrogenase [Planctomycetota bacterium]